MIVKSGLLESASAAHIVGKVRDIKDWLSSKGLKVDFHLIDLDRSRSMR